jgi:DNA-binding response OmpR family regulator
LQSFAEGILNVNRESTSPHRTKILVVDDDIFITEILKGIAEKLGCEVKCVHDGKDVGRALVAYEPEVIFLDLVLPGIDGVEIIKVLAKVGSKAKIVLMSGLDKRTLSSVREVARSHQLDITDAVSKPFAPGQVEGILAPIIESTQKSPSKPQSDAIDYSFGPKVLFEPEIILHGQDNAELDWVRAQLIWQTDDYQSIEISSFFANAAAENISRGLFKLLLQQIRADSSIFQNATTDIGLRLPIDKYLLEDDSTPDFLDQLIQEQGLCPSKIMFEVCESSVLTASESTFDVLTRLKIKGFKLAVCVKDQNDQVLAILNKLPIDELVIDMSGENYKRSSLESTESEFQIGSLVSYATGAELATSGKNIFSEQQFAFASRCKLSKLSGRNIREPGDGASTLEFLNQTAMEVSCETAM